jgi:hypothetical protein
MALPTTTPVAAILRANLVRVPDRNNNVEMGVEMRVEMRMKRKMQPPTTFLTKERRRDQAGRQPSVTSSRTALQRVTLKANTQGTITSHQTRRRGDLDQKNK